MPDKTHEAVTMALDSMGNILVAGSSQNSSNLLDYVTLKYSPQGTLLWSKTFGETNLLNDTPRGMEIDTNDTIYVTGTSKTVAYAADGTEKWTSPLGGRAIAVTGTNLYVAGFSDSKSSTAKLDMGDGHAVWTRSKDYSPNTGPDLTQSLTVDSVGNVYIFDSTLVYSVGNSDTVNAFVRKFSPEGAMLNEISLGSASGDYVAAGGAVFESRIYFFYKGPTGLFNKLVLDSDLNITDRNYRSGSIYYGFVLEKDYSYHCGETGNSSGDTYFRVVKFNQSASLIWEKYYKHAAKGNGFARSMALYLGKSLVTAGYFPVEGQGNNLALLNYDLDGNLVWVEQYNGAGNGRDEGVSVKVDAEGNIYVAGFSTTPQGGSEIILIKYTQTAIEKNQGANPKLQFPGEPGKQLKIEATPTLTLPDWTQIALGQVPTNSLFQVEDTNANHFPTRFYRSVSIP